ncbi:MAG: prenyltransferase/squalene oxidase repeat-containing protein [Planctomycetia bacterium]
MRRLLACLPVLAVLASLAALLPARADEPARGLVTPATREAIDRGLVFLARLQQPDGSWHSNAGKKINEGYRVFEGGRDVPHVGVTSLAVLAYLAGGHVPGRGPYGEVVDRAVRFLVEQADPASGMVAAHGTRMYSHAFATLALAEVYGMSPQPRVRRALEAAVDFTVRCQNETGGWRYVPFTADSDMSVTVCQVVALRAARNVGFKVPQATIDRAIGYVLRSAYTGDEARGGFRYQPEEIRWNRDSFALAAAGLTTLFQAGLYDNAAIARYIKEHRIPQAPPPRIEDTVRYLRAQFADVPRDHYFFWYGSYYATQAFYLVGGSSPREWAAWYTGVRDRILATRREARLPGGEAACHWVSNVDDTHAYATATALLILQFPLDYLPIHQR